MKLEYSYTVIDPQDGRARTFAVTTDSRLVALSAIRGNVQKINRERMRNHARSIPCPSLEKLDAQALTASAQRPAGWVSRYA